MKLERTSVPGIYLRGTKYILAYRDGTGKQRRESYPTLRQAKQAKIKRQAELNEGTYQPESHRTLHSYADEWIKSYDRIRDNTRDDYAYGIKEAKEFFSPRVKLTAITPKAMAEFVKHLSGKGYAPSSVAKRIAPLRSLFRSAMEEGLIRSNPCQGVRLPQRVVIPDEYDHEDSDTKAFSKQELNLVLRMASSHKLLLEFLACTGLRISEAIALEWRHLELNGSKPHVKVRRAIVRGKIGAPKSKYGRRVVPLPFPIVQALRMDERGPNELVFPSEAGTPLHPNSVMRTIRPVLEEAGVPWAGFHTFRHTFASMHIARGTNLMALSRVMGHHSAAFTLNTYGHLLEGDEAPALEIADDNSGDNAGSKPGYLSGELQGMVYPVS